MHHKPAVHYRSLAEMPSALADLVEACAFDHGRVYDSYLVVEQQREYFFASGWQGCVGFTRHGRYAHIVGGLLAPVEDRETLLAEFLAFAREERLHVSAIRLCLSSGSNPKTLTVRTGFSRSFSTRSSMTSARRH